jgi:drug/metabolite transporter (DMT)-like permease
MTKTTAAAVLRAHKWSILAALVSGMVYAANWMLAEYLYSKNEWIPGSKLHHDLASVQAAATITAFVLIVIGIRKEKFSIFTVIAIIVAVISMAGATV